MTELYIDNKKAAIATGTSIKVTMENPYFTKASEYTGEVELPIPNCYNSAIFGPSHRRDVLIKGASRPCRLIVNNRTLIEGTATVTEITESYVKVQLLGGNSYVNYQTRFESLYIDELELGSAGEGMKWTYTDAAGETEEREVETTTHLRFWLAEQNTTNEQLPVARKYPIMEWVMLPALRENEDTETRKYVNRTEKHSTGEIKFYHDQSIEPSSNYEYAIESYSDPGLAPQPYVVTIVERVVKKLGFTVRENGMADTFLKNTYIVNTTPTLSYAQMLPHWTVNEFLTEVENFFGVCFIFDTGSMSVRIVRRKEMYAAGATTIQLSDDTFTVSIDEDDTTDISNANISYKMDDDLKHRFNDDINEGATFREFSDLEAAKDWYSAGTVQTGANQYSGTVAVIGGRYYILYKAATTEVNELANLERGEDNEDIELKIRPAVMYNVPMETKAKEYTTTTNDGWTKVTSSIGRPAPGSEELSHSAEFIDIGSIIDGDSSESNTSDTMPVALFDGTAALYGGTEIWGGWTHGHDDVSGLNLEDRDTGLRLHEVEEMETHYDAVYNGEVSIDTTAPVEITYYDEELYDPTATFIDHGRKLACLKIEYEVTEAGIERAKTGTFYQIRE